MFTPKTIILSMLFLGITTLNNCSLYTQNENYSGTEFIFKNYTDTSFYDINISAAEVVGNELRIRYSEKISEISRKGNKSLSYVVIPKTNKWEEKFFEFLKPRKKGCIIIEFSNNTRIFIVVNFMEDLGSFLIYNRDIEVVIDENGIESNTNSQTINSIKVEDFKIIE